MLYSVPMTDTMTYTDFETEAEREEREAVQAGQAPLADSDYTYDKDMAEREAEEVEYKVENARYFAEIQDLLYSNPWDVDPSPWHHDPYGF